MPYHFEFDRVNKILRACFDGSVNDAEMRTYYFQDVRKLLAKFQFQVGIVDFSAVERLDLSTAMIREMAAAKPAAPNTAPVFIVAPAAHVFGLSRMFQIQGHNTRPMLQIVRSAEEAYSQLKLKGELRFEPLSLD